MSDDATVCLSCGAHLRPGAQFCKTCGTKAARMCHACGAQNDFDARFCDVCGAALPTEPAHVGDVARPAAAYEERRLVTALFCDLVGFTPVSERLDPEEVRDIQSAYFEQMQSQIKRYAGTVQKYAGDAVLALFGVPAAHEDDAERAVLCALGMQAAMESVGNQMRERWRVDPSIRVGVNTGDVVSGWWDASRPEDIDVSGDAVNTAARLQTAADPGEVLVGAETMWLTRRRIRFGEKRELVLKGKMGSIPAYPALGLRVEIQERWEGEERTTPLVGREREMTELLDLWARAKGGEGQLVTVVGEPGVGKSRLIVEFANTVLEDGDVRMVQGRCLSYGHEISLWLISDLLRSLFSIREQDALAQIADRLGTALPGILSKHDPETEAEVTDVLGEVLGLPVSGSMVARAGAEVRRNALIRSLRTVLTALTELVPTIVVLQDLHWIDAPSEEVVRGIVSEIPGLRMLVVVAQRPGWTAPWSELSWPERITLRSLGESEAVLLAGSVLGGVSLSKDLENYLAERAGGNPFFVEELLRALQEAGGIEQREGVMCLEPTTARRLPSTLTEVLLARLDRLESRVRTVAQVGSVIGRTFAVQLLSEVIGQDRAALEMPLVALQEAEIAFPRGAVDPEYVFKHVTMREVAYNTLVQKRRKELHLQTARAIAALYPSDEYAELIAYHYSRTDADEEAVPWLEKAGDRAAAVYSNESAETHYREAVSRVRPSDSGNTASARLHEKLGKALAAAGRYAECTVIRKTAIDEYTSLRDLEGAGRTTAQLALELGGQGRWDEGIARVEAMIERLQWREPSSALASLHNTLSTLLARAGRYQEMLAAAERAGQISKQIGDDDELARAEERRGTALSILGQIEAGLQVLKSALPLAEAGGDLLALDLLLSNIGNATFRMLGQKPARPYFERALAIARTTGSPNAIGADLYSLSDSLTWLGEWEQARRYLAEGVALTGSTEQSYTSSWVFEAMARLHIWEGNWEAARGSLIEAAAWADEGGDHEGRDILSALLSQLDVLEGEPERAIARLQPLVQGESWDDFPPDCIMVLAWACAAAGADEYLELSCILADRAVDRAKAARRDLLPETLRVRGVVMLSQGRLEEADRSLSEGLQLSRSMELVYTEAQVLVQIALLSMRQEVQAPARDRLREALAIFTRLGAKKDIEQVEELLVSVTEIS